MIYNYIINYLFTKYNRFLKNLSKKFSKNLLTNKYGMCYGKILRATLIFMPDIDKMSPPQKIIIRHKKSVGDPLRYFGYLFAATDNRRLLFLKECDKTLDNVFLM